MITASTLSKFDQGFSGATANKRPEQAKSAEKGGGERSERERTPRRAQGASRQVNCIDSDASIWNSDVAKLICFFYTTPSEGGQDTRSRRVFARCTRRVSVSSRVFACLGVSVSRCLGAAAQCVLVSWRACLIFIIINPSACACSCRIRARWSVLVLAAPWIAGGSHAAPLIPQPATTVGYTPHADIRGYTR